MAWSLYLPKSIGPPIQKLGGQSQYSKFDPPCGGGIIKTFYQPTKTFEGIILEPNFFGHNVFVINIPYDEKL